MFVRALITALLLWGTLPTPCQAASSSPAWDKIHSLAAAGNIAEALELAKGREPKDATYHYNVGTLYFRLEKFGLAVAHLEKADRLRPHDPDIRVNLVLSRDSLGRALGGQTQLDPASSPVEMIADNVQIEEVRGTFGVFAFILILFWIRSYRKTRSLRITLLKPTGVLGILALLITASLYGIQRWSDTHPPVVLLEKQTLRSGPGENYLELARFEAGVKLRMTGESAQAEDGGNWQQVRFSEEGDVAWVRESSLLLL